MATVVLGAFDDSFESQPQKSICSEAAFVTRAKEVDDALDELVFWVPILAVSHRFVVASSSGSVCLT